MEDGTGRKKVFSISLGSRGGASPGIEIRRNAGGGFEVHEVQAKPPMIDLPRRDTRHSFANRLEPAVLNYTSPWQQFLLPRRPVPAPVAVPSVDPQTIEIKKPQSRTIEIQRVDSYARPQTPPAAESPVQSPLIGQHNINVFPSTSLQMQSPFSGGGRTIQIQRELSSDSGPSSPGQGRGGSPTSPGGSNVRRIEIQRVESPLARSGSPQSPQSPSQEPPQYSRKIEIQRSDSPLSARSDSPSQRSGSSSPTVEVHKIGPHTLEITRNVGSPGPGSPRVLDIQHQKPSLSMPSKSRIIEIQRSDSPSSSPPGSPRILELKQGAPRSIPIQVSSSTTRPTPQGAEAPNRGERIIQIQRSDSPHVDSPHMQIHRIEPPHLEIQRNEPPPSTVIRQGPMDIRWPSSRRVEIRGILGRGLQRNRTLSFTIRGGKIEMGGLEGGKIFSLRAPKEDVAVIEREVKPALARGEPDGESTTFLRKKEAQLREKREQERLERERQQQQLQAALEKERKDKEKEKEAALAKQQEELQQQQQAKEQAQKERRDLEKTQVAPPPQEREKLDSKISKKDVKQAEKEVEKEKPVPVVELVDTTPKPKPSVLSPAVPSVIPDKPEPVKEKAVAAAAKEKWSPPRDLSAKIPQFYFPLGQPNVSSDTDSVKQKIKDLYSKYEGGKAKKENFIEIGKACGLSPYWKSGLFNTAGGEKSGYVTLQSMLATWTKLEATCHDDAARFVRMFAKPGCNYLVADDFVPLIQDVVDSHPGLSFLQDAPEFHSRYVHTVISRIFYSVNRSWSGRITVNELRRSCFLQTLLLLEEEEDINQITEFFSYEHFYVIYCKFWELDKDHDLFISKEDLAKHNDHAISSRMIDRIFSGTVTRGRAQKEGKMSYTEFVWFLISEEDKRHPTSIEYWFRCMDLDGDGVISMYEMEYFYEEQVQRMEALGIETLPYEDCLCQMLDMVKPKKEGCVALADLKSCKMTPIFFDTFFNLEKYLDHEQKDPFANVRDGDEPELSDWERYAAEEYEILVAEEGANEGNQEEIMYEDDFEPDDDEPISGRQDAALSDKSKKRSQGGGTEEDIYDFSTKDLGY